MQQMTSFVYANYNSTMKPLKDNELLDVYRKAKDYRLSEDFIALLESAIRLRNLMPPVCPEEKED